MNKLLNQIKADLALAMKVEIQIRKGLDETGQKLLDMVGGEDYVYAQKTVSRAIISMIPQLGKKPNETTEEDIQQLIRKYISMEKERSLYQLGFLKEADVEGKSSSDVKKIVSNKIQTLGDELTSPVIKTAQEYLPEQANDEEILEFIKTIDFGQFRNKMQAMGLIMKQFPGLDGNVAKKILLSYDG